MEIRIVLDEAEPPSGHLERVEVDDERQTSATATSFTGWLGMLRALSDVIGHSDPLSRS